MTNESTQVLKRVEMIIKDKRMSESAFAKEIGVPQKTLNSSLRGLSKPSFELIYKILEHYPEISADWLFRGSGDMYLYKQCDEGGGGTAPSVACGNEDIHSRLQKLQNELNEIRQAVC